MLPEQAERKCAGRAGWLQGIPRAQSVCGGAAREGTAPSSVDYSPIFPLTRSEHSLFLISTQIGFICVCTLLRCNLISFKTIIQFSASIKCPLITPNKASDILFILTLVLCDHWYVFAAVHQQVELQGCRTLQGWSAELPQSGLTDCLDLLPFICRSSRGEPHRLYAAEVWCMMGLI